MGNEPLHECPLKPSGVQRSYVHKRWLAILTLVLLAGGRAAVGQGNEKDERDKAKAARVPYGISLTPEQRREIGERVLSNKNLKGKGPHLKAIRVTVGEAPLAAGGKQTVTTVVIFDHRKGRARRVSVNIDTDELLQDVELPGHPQSSQEELEEATDIVRSEPELALLLERGGILDGGFIVADPTGSRRRLMQLKLLSSDRRHLLKALTVDLTGGTVASDPRAPGRKKE
jgi:hypothetical protein